MKPLRVEQKYTVLHFKIILYAARYSDQTREMACQLSIASFMDNDYAELCMGKRHRGCME